MRSSRNNRHSLVFVMVLCFIVSACGSTAGSNSHPTSSPTQASYFPATDTPLSQAPSPLKQWWAPYQVVTIPGATAIASMPSAPPVIDATNGVIPIATAQQWAQAFYRDSAWQIWALAHGQQQFMPHITQSPLPEVDQLSQGAIVKVPNCLLYPTSLALIPFDSNAENGNTQYAFLSTYTGPCQTTIVYPDGHTTSGTSMGPSDTVINLGRVRSDPILGMLWNTLSSNDCQSFQCPSIPTASSPPTQLPSLPPSPLPLSQASPFIQQIWSSYDVQIEPDSTVLDNLPSAPTVSNQTDGAVPQSTAQQWGQAFIQQAVWARWSWENSQLSFQQHLGDSSFFNSPVENDAQSGSKALNMPSCAIFPTSLTLQTINSNDYNGVQAQAAQMDQYKFVANYSPKCTVTMTFADGHTTQDQVPVQRTVYGGLQYDPLLGNIWYADGSINQMANGNTF